MTVARVLRNTFAVIAVTACLAAAQTPVPSVAFRQSLDDALWTGPLLAPNASTLPQGHVLVEPYLYDVISERLGLGWLGGRVFDPGRSSAA